MYDTLLYDAAEENDTPIGRGEVENSVGGGGRCAWTHDGVIWIRILINWSQVDTRGKDSAMQVPPREMQNIKPRQLCSQPHQKFSLLLQPVLPPPPLPCHSEFTQR